MIREAAYDPPVVASISPLRSRHAPEAKAELAAAIGGLLRDKELIDREIAIPDKNEPLRIELEDYARKYPVRRHCECWVDGGDQIAGLHPDTYLPFFINSSGSTICRLCNGEKSIGQIIARSRELWPSQHDETLVNDLMSFLLLLEEMDLIELSELSELSE